MQLWFLLHFQYVNTGMKHSSGLDGNSGNAYYGIDTRGYLRGTSCNLEFVFRQCAGNIVVGQDA